MWSEVEGAAGHASWCGAVRGLGGWGLCVYGLHSACVWDVRVCGLEVSLVSSAGSVCVCVRAIARMGMECAPPWQPRPTPRPGLATASADPCRTGW